MPALSVHLNRERPRDLAVDPRFEADRPFDVVLENHGNGAHVHLRLDEDLSRVARLRETNQFVPQDGLERVRIEAAGVTEPVTGILTISLGYGAETADVSITVRPRDESNGVQVGEDLARPSRREPGIERSLPAVQTVVLFVLAALALTAAVGAALTLRSTAVTVGAGVVVVAVLAAVVLAVLE